MDVLIERDLSRLMVLSSHRVLTAGQGEEEKPSKEFCGDFVAFEHEHAADVALLSHLLPRAIASASLTRCQ